MQKNATYQKLIDELKRIALLNSVSGILGWDEQVNLPSKSASLRAEQNAVISAIAHEASTHPQIGEWLSKLTGEESLDSDQKIVVKEALEDYEKATKLPTEFVQRKVTAQSKGYHAWAQARAENDYSHYAPYLQEQLDLSIETASYLGREADPYDYYINEFSPGLNSQTIDTLFSELKQELIPIVDQITDSKIHPKTDIFKNFPIPEQEAFLKKVIGSLGFDFEHGRIDRSIHPFCSGTSDDIRMTTRFDVNNPLDSLSSAIHETGHALYSQGISQAFRGTALAKDAGMVVHESQSRLWENQVGRSREFWSHFESDYRNAFPKQLSGISSDELYLALNAVSRNPIRVDSDEVTYNLHIILRFELEKQLFSGSLTVKDLPEAWRAGAENIIGLTPKDDTEGVLQDIHWSGGAFGYFPSYTLGNMMAAQLWYQVIEEIPELMTQIATGDFAPLLSWLRSNVHCEAKRYKTEELVIKTTGAPLSTKPLIRYLKERYLKLYI